MTQEGLVALHGFAQLRQAVPALGDDQEVGWRLWDGEGGWWGARQCVMPGIAERQTKADISSHTFRWHATLLEAAATGAAGAAAAEAAESHNRVSSGAPSQVRMSSAMSRGQIAKPSGCERWLLTSAVRNIWFCYCEYMYGVVLATFSIRAGTPARRDTCKSGQHRHKHLTLLETHFTETPTHLI